MQTLNRRRCGQILRCLLLALALPVAAFAGAEKSAEREVREVIAASVAAWNAGDLETFCSFYAEDARFASPKGLRQGRAEVLASYLRSYPDRAAMGTLSLEPLDLRVAPGGDAVSVIARWRLVRDADSPEGYTLIVFHRQAEGWRLVQDASM